MRRFLLSATVGTAVCSAFLAAPAAALSDAPPAATAAGHVAAARSGPALAGGDIGSVGPTLSVSSPR